MNNQSFKQWFREYGKNELELAFEQNACPNEKFSAFCRRLYREDQKKMGEMKEIHNRTLPLNRDHIIFVGDKNDFFKWLKTRKGKHRELVILVSFENPQQ